MLSVMNNTNNFDLENKDHTLSNSRVSPDSAVSDKTRVSNDDDVENNQSTLRGGNRKSGISEYHSMLLILDNYAEREKGKVAGAKQSFNHGYKIGDMVWGKVKSHPWWPGHIYDEAFALASVLRLKRKGFVLVAFFGDSSYGWFDPNELVPFETHFTEKSKQISAKAFVKAVEEAADEAGRRRGLGLACRCRNPYNFRPANVKGYFAVDVGDNEPVAVYSMDQITKARDEFRASDVIGFMKGLAVMPKWDGRGSLDFLKDKASVLAYRRAVFEEFDETYAQAFGQSPVQPSVKSREALMHSVKAPLSGPMVIAETLGVKKTTTKSNKKDHTNRDKYIFKRGDEANELKSQDMGHSTLPVQQPCIEASEELDDGDYVLQRRAPPVPPDQQTPGEHATVTEDKPSALNDSMVKSPSFGDRFSDPTRGGVSVTKKGDQSKSSLNHGQVSRMSETGIKVNKLKRPVEVLGPDRSVTGEKKTKKRKDLLEEMSSDHMQKLGSTGDVGLDRSVTKEKKKKKRKDVGTQMSSDHMQKLGSTGDVGLDRSVTKEKKKKKKKDAGTQMSSDHIQKLGTSGKGLSGDKIPKKTIKIDVDLQKKDDRADDSFPNSVCKTELKLVDLLNDLHSLALDPFHGRERNSPAFTRLAFLKFRSLIFQKSLGLSTPSEVEPNETHDLKPGKSSDIIRSATKDQPSSKKPKCLFMLGDQTTKGGQKRGPLDRQEEIAAKRLKKLTEIKSLTVDKKALGDGKDSVVARPQKPLKTELGKKMEAPRKIRELTMLVMKFPPQSTLPSENELRARLARFGPLDHSRMRIFWTSFTSRVVFIYKEDAEVAYRYITDNNNMFGSIQVKCYTRPLETRAPQDIETKALRDDGPDEHAGAFRALSTQSTAQIKSCLKKPWAGEAGPTPGGNGGSKGAARVKFVLGGGENSGGGEPLVSRNKLNNISFAGVGNIGSSSSSATSTSTNTTYGVDLINKKIQQKVVPQNLLSNSHSPQVTSEISNAPINFHFHQAIQPTNSCNFNANIYGVTQVGTRRANTDIAQEMLSLMSRCNDVVINLKSSLGYVPYFSL